jgi:putative oxidoreductase
METLLMAREFFAMIALILAIGLMLVWFLVVGIAKFASPVETQRFVALGLPAWVRIAMGVIEVIGALALLIPYVSFYAALALIGTLVGEIAISMRHGGFPGRPLVILALLVFIAYRLRPGRLKAILAEDPAQFS